MIKHTKSKISEIVVKYENGDEARICGVEANEFWKNPICIWEDWHVTNISYSQKDIVTRIVGFIKEKDLDIKSINILRADDPKWLDIGFLVYGIKNDKEIAGLFQMHLKDMKYITTCEQLDDFHSLIKEDVVSRYNETQT